MHTLDFDMFDFESVYDDAVRTAPSDRQSLFVEVGSWVGNSTYHMASAIKQSCKPITFFAVDTWEGDPNHKCQIDAVQENGGSVFQLFCDRISSVADFVIPLRMLSAQAAQFFRNESLEFVFIDANHSYQHVRNDIRAWSPKVRPGGIIAGHDIQIPSVRAAIEDQLPASQIGEIPGRKWTAWRWIKNAPLNGEWVVPLPESQSIYLPSHLLFMPYTCNGEILKRAADTLDCDGLRAFVIDDSIEGLDLSLVPKTWGVFKPASRITFTQIQNLAQRIAFDAGVKYLLFAHSDSFCTDNRIVPDLLQFAETRPDWAVVFTHYDVLCAFRTEAIRNVGPWDETFQWYSSDCDYYRRLRLSGWKAEGSDLGNRVNHIGSATLGHPVFSAEVRDQLSYQRGHYRHKWGGGDNEERFTTPYGF